MKAYAIFIENKHERSFTARINIFRIVKNVPVMIGQKMIDKRSNKGYKTETLEFLVDNGFVPKKFKYEYYEKLSWKGLNFRIEEMN